VAGWNGRVVWEVVPPGTTERLVFYDRAGAERFLRERGGRGEKQALNVDFPKYRQRLWSFVDSPLVYYLENFSTARKARARATAAFLEDDG
jgi:hypothetical protein